MRFSEPVNLEIPIDRRSPRPLRDQIVDGLRASIHGGVLNAGARLPSTRALASALGVSRSVTVAAVEMLTAAGYLRSGQGSGTYVNVAMAATPATAGPARPAHLRRVSGAGSAVDFAPGQPSIERFPLAAWRAAWRAAGHRPPATRQDPLGEAELRRAVAEYVRVSRGIVCEPGNVVIAAGTPAVFRAAAQVITIEGGGLAIERPTYPGMRRAFDLAGVALVPAPVDDEGLVVARLPAHVRHVAVQPNHHVPLGVRMSLARRRQWLDWVRRSGGAIVEHDQHGDFRYDPPLPSLWSMGAAEGRAVYMGSLGGLLSPTLRVDYLILSPSLSARRGVLQEINEPPPLTTQHAVRQLIEDGHLARQVRRMTPLYRHRRDVVRRVLGDLGNAGRLSGTAAGLHAALVLPRAVSAAAIAQNLRVRGVIVPTLSSLAGDPGLMNDGLVIGYPHLAEPDLERGLARIARVVLEHAAVSGLSVA